MNNALPADETAKLKTLCDNLIEQVMEKDPLRLGNRGKDDFQCLPDLKSKL